MMDRQTERRKLQKQQIILSFASIFQTQKQFSTLSNYPENLLSNLRQIILTYLLLLKKHIQFMIDTFFDLVMPMNLVFMFQWQ